MMTCEEFEVLGSEFASDCALDAEAEAHLQYCPHCVALYESWLELEEGLRAFARETHFTETPWRVETRLRETVRTERPRARWSRVVPAWAWGVAPVAVMAVLLAWSLRERPKQAYTAPPSEPQPRATVQPASVMRVTQPQASKHTAATVRSEKPRRRSQEPARTAAPEVPAAANDFVVLPYSAPIMPGDDATVVRMRMQRGALSMLGLPVNEERAGEWIQVDLLLGPDGQPQAVRPAR